MKELKFKKRLEKWNRKLLEAYKILIELHEELNEVYQFFDGVENAEPDE